MNNVKYSIYNEQIKKNKIAKVRLTIKRFRYLPDAYLYIVSCLFGIEHFKNF